jgi:hypothetical protein
MLSYLCVFSFCLKSVFRLFESIRWGHRLFLKRTLLPLLLLLLVSHQCTFFRGNRGLMLLYTGIYDIVFCLLLNRDALLKTNRSLSIADATVWVTTNVLLVNEGVNGGSVLANGIFIPSMIDKGSSAFNPLFMIYLRTR